MEKANLVVMTNGLTEKGNLKQAVARGFREQGIANVLGDFEQTPRGDYVLAIAEVDGKIVYLKANLSVSIADNLFDEPESSKAKVDAPEIPSIFG